MSCEDNVWRSDRWGTRETDKWPEAFPKPRTCAHCGSVNPEDLAKLVELGWELVTSTKAYKSYWHPPGYRERMNRALADIVSFFEGKVEPPKHVDPIPPVKLYGNHVTDEMAAWINALLAINRTKAGPPK